MSDYTLHNHILAYIGINQAAPTSDIMRDNILSRREVLAVCRVLERRGFIFKSEDSWGNTQRRSDHGAPTSDGRYADAVWVVNCEPDPAAFKDIDRVEALIAIPALRGSGHDLMEANGFGI